MEQSEAIDDMNPDAIIILSGGSVPLENGKAGAERFRSTTYEDCDAFGTLGGFARVQAGAVLAGRFPDAFVITTSKRGDEPVTHAAIQARELEELGVPKERIILEDRSENTESQLRESFSIAAEHGWKHLAVVSNEYHIPRIRAFCEHVIHPSIAVEYIAAESVLMEENPSFVGVFEEVKKTSAYQERLASEERGVEELESGTYRATPSQDKKEQ
ncbi:MAG: YdcF family protein [Patescibacteria group bacterium]|nr:YdcF family protein [Patescibacteria group bacterium]